jgi:hypothetical protein
MADAGCDGLTEPGWLTCTWPGAMLNALAGRASDRKLRLFACACYRRVWGLTDPMMHEAVAFAEAAADGLAPPAELEARWLTWRPPEGEASWLLSPHAAEAASESAKWSANIRAIRLGHRGGLQNEEWAYQADLLRCVFGNPYRPVAADPAWRTSAAVTLARAMYDSRDFAAMPLLADLLEEAGCPAAVSEHCRGEGPHVRGCWVVDLLLGRE